MDAKDQPAAAPTRNVLLGVLCGAGAAFGWAAGFVAAKHGINIGFSPADLAFHRFFWSGLALLPIALRQGVKDAGGVGWGRGLVMSVLGGPPQALIAYTGYIVVPLGHGTTIQPACAALFGIVLSVVMLREYASVQRILGGATIIVGLLVFGAESLTTIGGKGVGGDLLFVTAGFFWAMFGTLLRQWRISPDRAVATVGILAIVLYAPLFLIFVGFSGLLQQSLWENLLQLLVQGVIAGVLPIYLFARAVVLLGAGRAATFPALVPGFGLLVGYLALGVVPSIPQFIGFVVVVIGFRFTMK